jgi:hypothetical protein
MYDGYARGSRFPEKPGESALGFIRCKDDACESVFYALDELSECADFRTHAENMARECRKCGGKHKKAAKYIEENKLLPI